MSPEADAASPTVEPTTPTGERSRDAARIAMVGCGNISTQYLVQLEQLPNLQLVAVVDAVPEAAAAVADRTGVPARGLDEVLADPDVDVVLNLTTPDQHAPISTRALLSGKHVYQEKPFGLSWSEARHLAAAADTAQRRLGAAPDTVLGTGIQTARHAIDSGRIGQPVGATAFMLCPGHESWHPNPGFYYRAGGGPLLDMGVYYLTALVTLLGPITTVAGMGTRSTELRTVPAGAPRAGEQLPVEVDTHVAALLRHASGAVSTLLVSFDTQASVLPPIEVYGTAGTLAVPDPNRFDGTVGLATRRGEPFTDLEPSGGYPGAGRGVGLSDMVRAIAEGRPHRQSTRLGLHVHEVMEAVLTSAGSNEFVAINSGCERPDPVPYGARPDLA